MAVEIHAISTTVSAQVSGGDGHLSAEVDSRSWGYNGGRSQYFEGDTCYVIVYRSANVRIVGKACSNTSGWDKSGESTIGYNIQREGIAFTSPVASSSKPLPPTVTVNGSATFNLCSGPEYCSETTIVRLKKWSATLTPEAAPPYGFIFIEYEPHGEMWAFTNLKKNADLLNTAVHGVIYGVSQAIQTMTWTSL